MDNSNSSRPPSSNRPPTHENNSSLSLPPSASAPQQSHLNSSQYLYQQSNNPAPQSSFFPSSSFSKQRVPPISNSMLTPSQAQPTLPLPQPSQPMSDHLQPSRHSHHRSRPLDLSHPHQSKQSSSLSFPPHSKSSRPHIPSTLPQSTQNRSQLQASPFPPSTSYAQPASHHNYYISGRNDVYRSSDMHNQTHSSLPLPTHQTGLQPDFKTAHPFVMPPVSTSGFPSSSGHIQPTRSEPFPNSKSLPFPISQHPPPAPPVAQSSAGRPLTTASASASLPVLTPQQNGPPNTATLHSRSATPPHPHTAAQSFVLYDIAKLQAAKCSIIAGKVYNDKGHSICGVLNQHDKPCRRIGKCPFHGVATPVSAENSCNGVVDANGTAMTGETGEDAASPTVLSPTAMGDVSGSTPSTTTPPKKQQYKHGWSKEEHYLFLRGLEVHERGSWKQISNLVQSRNATQVQSHAQKYFLRQKQNNKNKRSIHDLTMDSPEMQEMDRRYRNGEFRSITPSVSLTDNLYGMNVGDGSSGKLRESHGAGLGSVMTMAGPSHSGMVGTDGLGAAVVSDTNLNRYGPPGATAVGPRYGPGQAMSATTLGSSMSSGVHIPQLSAAPHQRTSFNASAPLMSHDLLGSGSNGTISSHKKIDVAFPRPGHAPDSRDVAMTGPKPMLPHATYSNPSANLNGHPLRPEHKVSDAAILGTAADRGNDGHHENGHGQAMYGSSGFSSLYAHANPNALFPQTHQRTAGDGQLAWQYGSDMKSRRPNPGNGKDSFQIQSPFAGMTNLPIADGYCNVGGVNQVDQTLEGGGNQQTPAFGGGLFTGTEGVEVAEGGQNYGVHGGGAQGMNGFGASGLQLGGMGGVRGHGGMPNSFSRN